MDIDGLRLEYKCRRCGAVDSSTGAPRGVKTFDSILDRVLGHDKPETGMFLMRRTHECADGGLGVSDLIGTDKHPVRPSQPQVEDSIAPQTEFLDCLTMAEIDQRFSNGGTMLGLPVVSGSLRHEGGDENSDQRFVYTYTLSDDTEIIFIFKQYTDTPPPPPQFVPSIARMKKHLRDGTLFLGQTVVSTSESQAIGKGRKLVDTQNFVLGNGCVISIPNGVGS